MKYTGWIAIIAKSVFFIKEYTWKYVEAVIAFKLKKRGFRVHITIYKLCKITLNR